MLKYKDFEMQVKVLSNKIYRKIFALVLQIMKEHEDNLEIDIIYLKTIDGLKIDYNIKEQAIYILKANNSSFPFDGLIIKEDSTTFINNSLSEENGILFLTKEYNIGNEKYSKKYYNNQIKKQKRFSEQLKQQIIKIYTKINESVNNLELEEILFIKEGIPEEQFKEDFDLMNMFSKKR